MTIDMQPENATSPIDRPRDAALRAAMATRPPFLKSRTALAIGVGLLGLFFGVMVDGGEGMQTVQAAVPVTTVAQASATAPAACLEALDRADEAFSLASAGFTVVSESYTALGHGDYESVVPSASKLTGITSQITLLSPDYLAAKQSCRGF